MKQEKQNTSAMLLQGLPRSSLQLAGVACELIAAKHEEVHPCSPCTDLQEL